jgi:monomeric isocitrate dehydrogenase
MSEAKHTPGPWEIIGDHQDDRDVFANNELIATAYDLRHVEGDARANARLIAAAPELFTSLERICAEAESWHKETGHEDDDPIIHCDGICACIPQMRAAIRKAKGER